jgi:hypothetical protein
MTTMYTPPQQDSFGFDSPVEAPAQHNTYLYTPQGLGRKEKRENWIWKTYEPRTPKPETHHHNHRPQPHHEQAEAFSYEYVMEEGKLATITEKHPQTPVEQKPHHHQHAHTRSEELPRRRPSTKLTKPAPVVDRHSSPAATRTHKAEKENRHLEEESKASKLKRALSLSSAKARLILTEHEKDRRKPLPALPKPSTPATTPIVQSFGALGPSLPIADEFSTQRYSGNPAAPLTPELSPRLSSTFEPSSPLPSPRRYSHGRRPSLTVPQNATPRLPSPRTSAFAISAPHTLQTPSSPPRSFEEPRKSPLPPVRKPSVTSSPPQQQVQSHPPTPPSTPPADRETHQAQIAVRPQLKRKTSKFIELLEPASSEIEKNINSLPIPVIQHPPVPARPTIVSPAPLPSPSHRRYLSADHATENRKDSFFDDKEAERIRKPEMIELRHSPARAPKTLQAATISSQQATLVPARQATVATRPLAAQYVDIVGPKSATLPRRSMSMKVPNERRPRETWPEMPRICTAELRPVLASPVVAVGTARLVKC